MRLVSCHVENFGKLSAYDCSFDEGLNVLCHENGWGKSTLMAFVKCMFYGLANDRVRTYENERKRYAPWQGGVFGGRLKFAMDGHEYEISRTFGAKAAEDSFSVIDCATNLQCQQFSAAIGREIFGIDEDSFARSCFIAQGDVPGGAGAGVGDVTGDISAKIGNLADNTDDMGNYETAVAAIGDKLNKLSETRATGEICKLKGEAMKLKGEISLEESYEQSMEALREKIAESQAGISDLTAQNEKLTGILDELTQWQDDQIKREKYMILDKQYCEAKAAADDAEAEVRKLGGSAHFYSRNESVRPDESRTTSGLAIAGAVLLGIGVVDVVIGLLQRLGTISATGHDMILFVVGGVMIILGVIFLIIGGAQNNKARILAEEHKVALATAQGKLDSAKGVLEAASVALNDFKATYGTKFLNANDHKGFGEGSGREFNSGVEINEKIKANRNEIERLRGFIASYNDQLEDKQSKLDEIAGKKESLEALTAQIDDGRVLVRRLELARELLAQAKNNVTSKYIDPLSVRFVHYYEMVTGGNADAFALDANSHVSVDQFGQRRGTMTLSTGLQDAVGFCLRMALVDAMYPDEKPPVILDDAFTNMDDANYAGAMRVLEEVAREYQVIYFTCRK